MYARLKEGEDSRVAEEEGRRGSLRHELQTKSAEERTVAKRRRPAARRRRRAAPSSSEILGEAEREPGDGEGRVVDEGVVDALVAEEPGEDAAVGGEAREGDPRVVGDAEDLALVGGELVGGLVGGCFAEN